MKVLMQIRGNYLSVGGGDSVQLTKTKEALEKLGVEVEISTEFEPDLTPYDIVHLFNLTRVQETYLQMKNAVSQKKPIVLSTIYWPNTEFEREANIGIRKFLGKILDINRMERVKACAKYILLREKDKGTKTLIAHKYQDMQREILQNTDVFLPNAFAEMEQIKYHLGFDVDPMRVTVVPNAIDSEAVSTALESSTRRFAQFAGSLVCVGRIDARKNQLRLIEAIENSEYQLILIGKRSPGQKKYFKKVMKRIKNNPNVVYLESVSNYEIYQLFKECKVSILPSWFETPGLVSLEAAVMGCNIVVGEKGTTKDYFGEHAFYCDIRDPSSIKKQIDLAYQASYCVEFRDKILTDYTWDQAAKQTLKGYAAALLQKEAK